jgi:hypothetical protein
LSLGDVPGLATLKSAAGGAYDAARTGYGAARETTASAGKWLLPLLGLAALAVAFFVFWPKFRSDSSPTVNLPSAPDVASVTKNVTGALSSMTDTLSGLTDAASVQAALPKITEWGTTLAGIKGMVDKLPESARTQIANLVRSSTGKLSEQFSRILMIPGVSDQVRPALEGIVNQLSSIGNLPTGQLALPSIEVTNLGRDLSGTFASLTETITGIKDTASAEAALPKLTQINDQLDTTKGAWNNLPQAGRTTIGSMVASALATLKAHVTRLLAMAGVADKVKPVVDQIMTKLASFSA